MQLENLTSRQTIFAVASFGGHWIQLLRITRGLADSFTIIYSSTNPKCAAMVDGSDFVLTTDFSRWNPLRIFPSFFGFLRYFSKNRPQAVISTGAAPGLAAIIAARLFGIKTIWIDSIANAEKLSFSGRVARWIASRTYTQWPDLADGKTFFVGNVFK